ncbi:type II toxin-antitoxin system RelE/ParE family toxin [Sedimenticola hydrogenitrophicus]|uniref:type II toxin-antitoxin system RelE/ParE family toxin n=1 Tax=Sedimenticola hydrogenitrophicus TaxID=2967975 RepID=UPI003B5871B1
MSASASRKAPGDTLPRPGFQKKRNRTDRIYRYVAIRDSVKKAAYVLDQLEPLCSSLADLPMRGHIRPELDRMNSTNTRRLKCMNFY